jgi:hypothetical protein
VADPFNSAGGFSTGIPPIQFIDENNNLTANVANVVSLNVSNNAVILGTISADNFIGNLIGNIEGNLAIPGDETGVVYNNEGVAKSDANFTYDVTNRIVVLNGDLIANSLTVGSGVNQFSTSRVLFATTVSSLPDQVLLRTDASSIASIDYMIIATDSIANTRQVSKLFAAVLGDTVEYLEFGTLDLNGGVGDFKVEYDSGDVLLTVKPVTSNLVNYKIQITSYKE